ncbi:MULTISPECIES: sugar phosphate isomerase/epimerase family protein [Paenibacillus]|uniref:sugar phosphate isomerase/epimerase family protein n=1 Tax=Paenibacillus TaxID=44249 RepID=UPI00096D0D3E|nr:TIM barrel protein [Paenibacillus odorifer]MEC0131965.1 TIM barrel protein [Paenibacillus odorifer]MEC0221649.1 TIM barrel protein [Paenibacillus odorifer]OMC91117.1 xylose isomerase [Paenibacillus odorifer]
MEDKGIFSFSTCWNIKRHTAGDAMLREIRDLGFQRVELNYNVTKEMLETIEPMLERGEMGVSSVHNTFPHVQDSDYGTDSVLLGFEDKEKRQRAIELLIGSAKYAQRYGGEAVVVHPGEVPFPNDISKELEQIYNGEGRDSNAYRSKWAELMERREAYSAGYVQKIIESLDEVCNRAVSEGLNVRFGIETRSKPQQIPTLAEAKTIIKALKGAPVGIWYDTGHAIMMDRLGLYDSVGEMEGLMDDIVGVHIHETIGLSDHWCPYVNSGNMEFYDAYLPMIERAQVKVYELKAACQPEEIDESHRLLMAKLARRGQV